MIMAGEVEPVQLGAFLMLMRVKEETREELAGFILGVQESLAIPSTIQVDLDWSSYAGKRRHLPWFLLATLLLAENGIKVFMHGESGHTSGRVYTQSVLHYFGLTNAKNFDEVKQQLEQQNFCYMGLEHLSPKLHEIINLRALMGLRSPVHTLARMTNPCRAPYVMQGIFHPNYRQVHQEAALLINQPHLAVFKGDGGEIERDPDAECVVQSVHHGELSEEVWTPIFPQRHVKEEVMQPERLVGVWRGDVQDEYAEGAVYGTAAIALRLMGKAQSAAEAQQMALDMWQARSRHKY
jgi:anthranilate phosphoribosyltransferase